MMRFRALSLLASFVVCTLIIYGLGVMKVTSFEDLLEKAQSVELFKEKKPPPPPPPPPPEKPPPPPPIVMRQAPVVTEAPPVETELPVANPPPAPVAAVITDPHWIKRPNGRDFERYYPSRALEREKEGKVVLNCVVQANGSISCSVSEESPEGWGFGDAAIKISRSFQMSPRLENGQPTEGGRVSVPIVFRLGG
jgi:protein TonB